MSGDGSALGLGTASARRRRRLTWCAIVARRRRRNRDERTEHDVQLLALADELEGEGGARAADRAQFVRDLVDAASCEAVVWLRVRRWLRQTRRRETVLADRSRPLEGYDPVEHGTRSEYAARWAQWAQDADEHERRSIWARATGAGDVGPPPVPPSRPAFANYPLADGRSAETATDGAGHGPAGA